ncbi:MAG: M20/M25/M40 family metallo-hydrolase [Pyrinomonadaceae bacterium]
MKTKSFSWARLLVACALLSCAVAFGQSGTKPAPQVVLERDVLAHEEFLASDAMQGRGSMTQYELLAGVYVGAQLRQFGVEPAGDLDASGQRTYIQTVEIPARPAGADATGAQSATAAQAPRRTYNAVGVLRGSDPKLANEVVLLTAHMDHLGVAAADNRQCRAAGDDTICNGADDDASGVAAVLELARVLGAGARPKRTVYFVTFGSEERGGFGARYFLEHPPVPLTQIVANLEFEMIGRPDPKVAAGTLWLTGYERSNLGAELAKHGANLVADPHPEQQFFRRSDNYALARQGVVAHTVSSFGLHPEYHQPGDDLAHLDIAHMTRAINSMVEPVRWLVDTDFKPAWVEGGKP